MMWCSSLSVLYSTVDAFTFIKEVPLPFHIYKAWSKTVKTEFMSWINHTIQQYSCEEHIDKMFFWFWCHVDSHLLTSLNSTKTEHPHPHSHKNLKSLMHDTTLAGVFTFHSIVCHSWLVFKICIDLMVSESKERVC